MNEDQQVDGQDISEFVDAVLASETRPPALCHGDFSVNGVVDSADVPGFVAVLLGT
jgi:hypothetical protein